MRDGHCTLFKKTAQNLRRGFGVYRLFSLLPGQSAAGPGERLRRIDAGVALVNQIRRSIKAACELPGKFLATSRHCMWLTVRMRRPTHDECARPPFFDQRCNRRESSIVIDRLNRGERVSRLSQIISKRHTDTSLAKIEGEKREIAHACPATLESANREIPKRSIATFSKSSGGVTNNMSASACTVSHAFAAISSSS